MKRPERENTYRLVRQDSPGLPLWLCQGLGGCGCVVGDPQSHAQFHDLAESEVVRSEKRIKDLESEVEKLKASARLPRRGR